MAKTYKCEKCGEYFELAECTDVMFTKHHLDGSRKQVAKIRLCDDCAEKAQVVLADALELPDWD